MHSFRSKLPTFEGENWNQDDHERHGEVLKILKYEFATGIADIIAKMEVMFQQ